MTDETKKPGLVDAHGRPAKAHVPTCPRCGVESPKGDVTKRTRSSGFGGDIHDVCMNCGYDFEGELTV